MSRLDNRAYYDDFAGWYENERHLPYHRMLDDLEVDLVARYGADKDVLEVGCGTGLILGRVASFAGSATGVDLSAGMLAKATERGLSVIQGSATNLPVRDASVYLLTDCTLASSCLAGRDNGVAGDNERLLWTNATGSDVTAYLGLDCFSAACEDFTATVEIY